LCIVFLVSLPRPPSPTLFPYTTLFRSLDVKASLVVRLGPATVVVRTHVDPGGLVRRLRLRGADRGADEHDRQRAEGKEQRGERVLATLHSFPPADIRTLPAGASRHRTYTPTRRGSIGRKARFEKTTFRL